MTFLKKFAAKAEKEANKLASSAIGKISNTVQDNLSGNGSDDDQTHQSTATVSSYEDLSSDSNTRTVVRALKSATNYVETNPGNAIRDLNRANSYLNKCPAEDQAFLQAEHDRLLEIANAKEKEAELQHKMTQYNRQVRYAKEAIAKNNVSDAQRYCSSALKEIEKLEKDGFSTEDLMKEYNDLGAELSKVNIRAQSASTIRQLQREFNSVKDVVRRGGKAFGADNLDPYRVKIQNIIDKLPEELKDDYQQQLDDLTDSVTAKSESEAEEKPKTTQAQRSADVDADTQRQLAQVERQLRYAREAMEKPIIDDRAVNSYLANARREIGKLRPELQPEQIAICEELEDGMENQQERARAAYTIRRLEREMPKSQVAEHELASIQRKLRNLVADLPQSIQEEWHIKVDGIGRTDSKSVKEEPTRAQAAPMVTPDPSLECLDPSLTRMMERSVGSIETSMERNEVGRAEYAMEKGLQNISQYLPAEHQAYWIDKMESYRPKIEAAQKAVKASRFLAAAQRNYDTCEHYITTKGLNAESYIDELLERFNASIEEHKDVLSIEQIEEIHERCAEFKNRAQTMVTDQHDKYVSSALENYENALQSLNLGDQLYGAQTEAQETIERYPGGAPHSFVERMKDLNKRLQEKEHTDKQKEGAEAKRQAIREIEGLWKDQARVIEEFRREQRSLYHKSTTDVGLPQTTIAIQSLNGFLQQVQGNSTELECESLIEQAKETLREATQKYADGVKVILDEIDIKHRPTYVMNDLKYLRNSLKELKGTEDILATAGEMISEKITEIQTEVDLTEQRKMEATENAESMWDDVLDGYGDAEEDPDMFGMLENPKEFRGTHIICEDASNELVNHFACPKQDVVVTIDGIPLVLAFSSKTKKQLDQLQKDIGAECSVQKFDSLIVKVKGPGKAQKRHWNKTYGRWDMLDNTDAIYGTIVAFRSGPFAADSASGKLSYP